MLNALRLADGVPVGLFRERTGFPLTLVESELEEAEKRGLLGARPREPASVTRWDAAFSMICRRCSCRGNVPRRPGIR